MTFRLLRFTGLAAVLTLSCSDAPTRRDGPSAGPGPRCVAPAAWPSLPTVAAIAERPASLSAPPDSAERALDTTPSDRAAAVPQYAFYRHSDGSACDPVIVVRVTARTVEYWGVDLTSRGAGNRELFELLGTTPRAGRR